MPSSLLVIINTPARATHSLLAREALREAARARLDGAHAPKRVLVLEALPLRPSGKVDRREVARLLATTTTDVTSEPLTPEP